MAFPSTLRATLVAASCVAAGTVFACGSNVTLGYGTSDDGSLVPDATSPVDGDAAADAAVDAQVCVRTACPGPWTTCASADGLLPTYACATNLDDDLKNCGACGVVCREPSAAYHVHMGCSQGRCQAFCNEHFADCNGVTDDGCEADIADDPKNCGACGITCESGVRCIEGRCGCPAGLTDCDGRCVDIQSSNVHCGSCGFTCADHPPADAGDVPPNMAYVCQAGQCSALRCIANGGEYWADCNGDASDGCEINLRTDASNCGRCGTVCPAGKQCMEVGGVVGCQCQDGETLCPAKGNFYGGCTDLERDAQNCGACGYTCPSAPNARGVCVHGRCETECAPKTADCNGLRDDGCEVDLDKDPRNCGGCGAMCDVAAGQPCVGGFCLTGECEGPVTR